MSIPYTEVAFNTVSLILYPCQVEQILKEHGVKMINEVDAITRKSMACPSFPLCGLAMAEAERVQASARAAV